MKGEFNSKKSKIENSRTEATILENTMYMDWYSDLI
jgi:hypothetical protein